MEDANSLSIPMFEELSNNKKTQCENSF